MDENKILHIVFRKDRSSDELRLDSFDGVEGEIIRRTEKRVGSTNNISPEPILLDIYSPDYPDLQFVDLPGFTKTSVDNQSADICQQIENLNIPIMQNPNTIILAIHDATQDIANSSALQMALREDVDPNGERTVCVLTKLDNLVANSDKDKVVKILQNQTKALKFGYYGVVSRSQDNIDRGVDIGQCRDSEAQVLQDPVFVQCKKRLGTDVLRNFITRLLADKMRKLMPELRQKAVLDLSVADEELKKNGRFDDANVDHDDLIAELVQTSMKRITINLQGLHKDVRMDEPSTGADINKIIKDGALAASKSARQTYSVEDFLQNLNVASRNVTGYRDPAAPEPLVLDIGVKMLIECYREPFLSLLTDSCNFLKQEVCKVLEDTLGMYPQFLDLVREIAMEEIGKNKGKAEEYLNVQIDINKNFVNCDHSEFEKMKKMMKKSKHRNHFDLWFKESIPTAAQNDDETSADDGDSSDSDTFGAGIDILEAGAAAVLPASGIFTPVLKVAASKVRGIFERNQNNTDAKYFNKFPPTVGEQAMQNVDLCLEYMEIMDKSLLDQIPKLFLMMLCDRLLDFLAEGKVCGASLLRRVQKEIKNLTPAAVMVKSFAHEEMIKDLKNRKIVAEKTVAVIDRTMQDLKRF